MSKVEQKFKVGDKVVCNESIDNLVKGFVYEVESYIVGKHKDYVTLVGQHGLEYFISRFELYKEKEMKEYTVHAFDLKKNPWYIRVENEEQFNLANEWLKETFGKASSYLRHASDIKYLTNFDGVQVWDRVLIGSTNFRPEHEIKLNYKTTISSVEYPAIETEQQKRIRELKETIENASKQLEELMKETK